MKKSSVLDELIFWIRRLLLHKSRAYTVKSYQIIEYLTKIENVKRMS